MVQEVVTPVKATLVANVAASTIRMGMAVVVGTQHLTPRTDNLSTKVRAAAGDLSLRVASEFLDGEFIAESWCFFHTYKIPTD